jgi:hypothetical protein
MPLHPEQLEERLAEANRQSEVHLETIAAKDEEIAAKDLIIADLEYQIANPEE